MARVVAVVQARMGSKRLPGKVIAPIAGRPMLWHIVTRLRRCAELDEVVVATTNDPADDPVAAFCTREGIAFVRGSEDDVLSRFLLAAHEHDAELVVRVNGDAPLVCPHTVDRLVVALREAGTDYCTGEPTPPCIHAGFDPVRVSALERLAREAGDDPVAREHVTAYFAKHPGFATTTLVPIEPPYVFEGARISVDTPADVAFHEAVHEALGAAPGDVDVAELVVLLKRRPELLALNGHVRQKRVDETSRNLLVRCDGDGRLGMGHVVRCLAIAGGLREGHGYGVRFAVRDGESAGAAAIRADGFPVDVLPSGDEAAGIDGSLSGHPADAILLDVRTDLPAAAVRRWRSEGLLTVVLDDPSPRRLAPDLAIYPPVPQLDEVSWEGFDGVLLAGWEWLPLRPAFADIVRPPRGTLPQVLVTAGGSDPGGLTLPILEALETVPLDFTVVVVVGAAFLHDDALAAFLETARPRYRVARSVSDMAGLMAASDLAVVSFGVTAYELAAAGVPSVLLGLTDDHARSAEALASADVAVALGVHDRVGREEIAQAARALLEDPERRKQMAERAAALVDGRGAARIAERIDEALRRRSS